MDCGRIPTITYTAFGNRLEEKLAERRLPLWGSFEITARCNLRCAHCYINEPIDDRMEIDEELSRDEVFGIIDQLVAAGCLSLNLTGGEPFVRGDFLDIYRYAKGHGLLITLYTNGTTVTPEVADVLAEWRPLVVEITLYGRTRETYERVTGVEGSYERCIRGIELLRERGVPLELKSMALTLNRHEIEQMQAYAAQLGLKFRHDATLNLRLDGGRQPDALRLSPEEVVEFDRSDRERLAEWRRFLDTHMVPSARPELLYQCGAGRRMFHIDSRGRLSVCMMARHPHFDLRRGSFAEGWENFLPEVLNRKWKRNNVCSVCDLGALCSQCPGYAQIEHGDEEQGLKYLCRIAQARARAFDVPGRGPYLVEGED